MRFGEWTEVGCVAEKMCGSKRFVTDRVGIVDGNNIMVRDYVVERVDCSKFLGLIALKKC